MENKPMYGDSDSGEKEHRGPRVSPSCPDCPPADPQKHGWPHHGIGVPYQAGGGKDGQDLDDLLYEQVQLISDLIKEFAKNGPAMKGEEILKLAQAQELTINMYKSI